MSNGNTGSALSFLRLAYTYSHVTANESHFWLLYKPMNIRRGPRLAVPHLAVIHYLWLRILLGIKYLLVVLIQINLIRRINLVIVHVFTRTWCLPSKTYCLSEEPLSRKQIGFLQLHTAQQNAPPRIGNHYWPVLSVGNKGWPTVHTGFPN